MRKEAQINGDWKNTTSPKRGRPKKVNLDIISIIDDEISKNPRLSAVNLSQRIDLSPSMINSIRNEIGFHFLPPKKQTDLTQTQIINRLKFGYSIHESKINLLKILFSDESKMSLYSDNRNLWRKRGSRNANIYCKQKKFYQSFIIFGIIGIDYKSKLVISNINIDSEQYCYNLIQSGVLDYFNSDEQLIFQQDGATSHTSEQTLAWVSKRINLLNHWPSNSPDLSPIENVWGMMDTYVKQKCPQTIKELEVLCKEYWDNVLTIETINKLCNGFVLRINEMLYLEGQNINEFLRNHLKDSKNDLSKYPHKPEGLEIYNDIIIWKDSSLADQENFHPEIRCLLDSPMSPNKKGPWSQVEDQMLREFIFKYGHKWEYAPLVFGDTRTPGQLRYRYKVLQQRQISTSSNLF